MFEGDLSSVPLSSLPSVFDLQTDVLKQSSWKAKADAVCEKLSKIPMFSSVARPASPKNFSWCEDFLLSLLRKSDLTDAKYALKVLTQMLSDCKPGCGVLTFFVSLLQSLRDSFDFDFLAKPLAIALICQKLGTVTFARRHLLSLDKTTAASIVNILGGDNEISAAKGAFILSVVVPSLEYVPRQVVPPKNAVILPDPVDILKYSNDFGDNEFSYACHIMQLCYRYLMSLTRTRKKPNFNDMGLFLSFCRRSFPRACLSRAIFVALRTVKGQDWLGKVVQMVNDVDCPPILESFFLFNTSPSFKKMLPFIGNYVINYFMSHSKQLGREMRYLISAYEFDLKKAGECLASINLSSGNQIYLYWLYVFFSRFSASPMSDRVHVINEHASDIAAHLRTLRDLIQSVENIVDPLIDSLLCSTITALMAALKDIVAGFDSPLLIGAQLFDLVMTTLHYLVSTQTLSGPCSLSISLMDCYREISLVLSQGYRLFEPSYSRDFSPIFLPMYALAFANLPPNMVALRPLISDLLLSDNPIVFNCLAHLVEKCAGSKDFVAGLVDILWDVIYVMEPIDLSVRVRVLVRLCLIFAVLFSSEFFENSVDLEGFGPFYASMSEHVIEKAFNEGWVTVQEASIFFLEAFYQANFKAYSGDHFVLIPFFEHIESYGEAAATALLRTFVSQIRYFGGMPFEIRWEMVANSRASNIEWFNVTIAGFEPKENASKVCTAPKLVLPWRAKRQFSALLEDEAWAVELTHVTDHLMIHKDVPK